MTEPRLRPLVAADRAPIAAIVSATGAFNAAEEAVALELVDEALSRGEASGYHFLVAEAEGQVTGYTCFGQNPMSDGAFDLYWIVVDPRRHKHGVGRALLRAAESEVRRRRGRMLIIETAGKESYAAQRAFYERCGYTLAASLPDFYAVGDDKLFYLRRMDHG